MAPALAGVVLAGGASRRMGCDKATLVVPRLVDGDAANPGTTMVEHMVEVVGQRCEPVYVVAAPGQPLPKLRAQVMRDEVRGLGPLPATGRGLRAALQAGVRRAFVCAVDMPFLTADVIETLAERADEVDAEVVLPWDGRDHYLAAVYRTDLAERIDALVAAGQRSMRALVDSADAQRIVMPESRALANVNSAAQLRTLVGSGQ
ncbi:MAG: molybdenum cofactor guanylyltransferase [Mycobacterium sp.]